MEKQRKKASWERNADTMSVVFSLPSGEKAEFSFSKLDAEVQKWISLYGLSQFLSDRTSALSGKEKIDAMQRVYDELQKQGISYITDRKRDTVSKYKQALSIAEQLAQLGMQAELVKFMSGKLSAEDAEKLIARKQAEQKEQKQKADK